MNLPSWLVVGYFFERELSDSEKFFIENKDRATCVLETQDPEACYSYDDWTLCVLDGTYYVFSTSGCSCPSPSETWRLEVSGSKEQVQTWIDMEPGYSGFKFFKSELAKTGWHTVTPIHTP